MIEVELPDGTILEFPEGMSREDMKAAVQKYTGQGAQPSQRNADGTYGQPPQGTVVNPDTGQMTNRDLLRQNAPVSQSRAAGLGYQSGFALSADDEMMGLLGNVEGALRGDPRGVGDFRREQYRAMQEANQAAFPKTTLTGQVGGAVLNPALRGKVGPAPVQAAMNPTTVRGGMALGGGIGAVEAFNDAEGDVLDRAKAAPAGAATSMLFSGIASGAARLGNKTVKAFFEKADEAPTVENLKAAKNAAYNAVKKSGLQFDGDEMQGLSARAKVLAENADFDDIADPQTAAVLRTLQKREGVPVSLDRLDRLRQTLWDRYNRGDEPLILDMIGEIDGLINSRAEGNALMAAARDANAKYSKLKLLDNAFRKASLQTAGAGSGGNILNKYRQAVTRIITNPKEARWFTPEEIKTMEGFVYGGNAENVLRKIGKISPDGNGLMAALNLYAATVNPALLTATAVGSMAKRSADNSAMRGADELMGVIGRGGRAPAPKLPSMNAPSVGGAVLGGGLLDR